MGMDNIEVNLHTPCLVFENSSYSRLLSLHDVTQKDAAELERVEARVIAREDHFHFDNLNNAQS